MTWARTLAQAGRSLLRQQGQASRAAGRQTRSYAGGHGHDDGVTYEGLTLHKPARWHVVVGKGLAGVMWFWVMYRFYNDFDTFMHELHEDAHAKEEAGEHH